MKDNEQLISQHDTAMKINEWFKLWDLSLSTTDVTIEFSNRLKSTLGRTHVAKHQIRLNPVLSKGEHAFLDEVLCHELAHIAVYEKFGPSVRIKGVEN